MINAGRALLVTLRDKVADEWRVWQSQKVAGIGVHEHGQTVIVSRKIQWWRSSASNNVSASWPCLPDCLHPDINLAPRCTLCVPG